MSRELTYFISDLHLGAKYLPDPREHERMVCQWLQQIAPTAKRLYLLGDILDYWFEYRYVVPRGYTRFFGTLASLADSGVEITWITGNHDIWIFDYLPAEIGFRLVNGPLVEEIDGRRFYLAHGDGIGRVPWGERLMRAVFRNRLLQRLFAGVHPRWTVGLAYGWSASNRTKRTPVMPSAEPLLQWVATQPAGIDHYIFGHYHMPLQEQIGAATVTILGDWLQSPSYALYSPSNPVTLH